MAYAAEGQISTDPIEGGIEISDEAYSELLTGLLEGKIIRIVEGEAVAEYPVPPEPPKPTTAENIINATAGLFGGPTIGALLNGY